MNITLEPEITKEEYIKLRSTTGWATIKPERVDALLKNTAFLVRAKTEEKTVGIARALFDFGYTAFISDVIVEPEYQGKGIGKMMIEYLISKVKEKVASDDFLKFNLMAAPGKSGFYEKLGFSKRDEQAGWGMCLNLNS
ncbi:MAG: GNAT family N-acetyltransferase [Treponema sp.]|nr:GNAT family N-acetyltransferase [Treponema sp.]